MGRRNSRSYAHLAHCLLHLGAHSFNLRALAPPLARGVHSDVTLAIFDSAGNAPRHVSLVNLVCPGTTYFFMVSAGHRASARHRPCMTSNTMPF